MSFSALLTCNSYTDDSNGQKTLPYAKSDGNLVATWLQKQLQVDADVGKRRITKLFNADATKMKGAIRKLGKGLEGMSEKPLV